MHLNLKTCEGPNQPPLQYSIEPIISTTYFIMLAPPPKSEATLIRLTHTTGLPSFDRNHGVEEEEDSDSTHSLASAVRK
ncbi:hypothetical protein WAI453_009606 [Rhynchosporium graminicola]